MKKLFLTSGLVLCMACPAYALNENGLAAGDINTVAANGPFLQGENGVTNTEPNCTVDTLQAYEGPVLLDAVWSPDSYTVTYAPGVAQNTVNGVANHSHTPTGTSPANETPVYDDGFSPAANPYSVTGYQFAGWAVSGTDDVKAASTEFTWQYTGDKTFTATWTPKSYTIEYRHGDAGSRTDGFTGAMNDETVKYDEDKTLTTNTWAIPGYTFTGWKGDYANNVEGGTSTPSGTSYSNGASLSPYHIDHDLILTAQWQANTYKIIYTCGGTVNPPYGDDHSASYKSGLTLNYNNDAQYAVDVIYDSSYTLATGANICELDGYDFRGWDCSGLTGSTPDVVAYGAEANAAATLYSTGLQSSSVYTNVGNVTCVAQWTPRNIQLQWYKDGTAIDVSGTSAASCTYDGSIILAPDQEKTGYTFQGWRVRTGS